MKIECKLIRKGGTHVQLGAINYHFAEQDDGRHVAEVTNEAHIERFLSIPEGYRLLRTPGAEAAELTLGEHTHAVGPAGAHTHPLVLEGELRHADGFKSSYTIDGREYFLGEFAKQAFIASGLTEIEWNELPDETRAIKIELVMDAVADGELTLPVPAPTPEPPPVEAPAPKVARAKKAKPAAEQPATDKAPE